MRTGRLFASALAVSVLTHASASAQFSEEWQDYAAEVEAECRAFEETLPGPGERLEPDGQLKLPEIPRGAPLRPHMCIYFRFGITGEGETRNIETLFKGPSNLHYVFIRKAREAIAEWKFAVPETHPEGFPDAYARITYVPVGNRRYNVRYVFWESGAAAGASAF